MKIRTAALGVIFDPVDFLLGNDGSAPIFTKLAAFKGHLDLISKHLQDSTGHEVQTCRVCTNSFEEWMMPLLAAPYSMTMDAVVGILDSALREAGIQMCSIGYCKDEATIAIVPKILALSSLLSCSVMFDREDGAVASEYGKCLAAAKCALELGSLCGDLGNFRFCASFNCPGGIPFFPAAYRARKGDASDARPVLTVGLENGDLLFLAFHGAGVTAPGADKAATAHSRGRDNLADIMRQICVPIQSAALSICKERGLDYGGIDASINPGLALPDSIGAGLESLLLASVGPVLGEGMEHAAYRQFGAFGTLAAVSSVTAAIKSLAVGDETHEAVRLAGYSGLMLPVMEDLILAQRADEGRYAVRDLLMFSAVCGVGIDTVPIPGNTTAAALAGVYMETAALAFRLNKPLSCRVLPMQGKVAGDVTDVDSPYLCNCKIFSL